MIRAFIAYGIACTFVPCLALQYTDWPGLVRTHQGQSAAFSWRLDTSLDDLSNEDIVFIYRQSSDVTVIYSKTPLGGEVIHPDYRGRLTAEYEDSNHRMTFTLSDMQQDDITGQYSCRVSLQGLGYDNDNVTLFLYKIPEDTTISPNPATTRESDTFTLTCSATLTSSPASLRPGVGYTWTRNDGPLPARHRVEGSEGQRLVISPVHRDDNQQKYTCVAQEIGSSFSGSTETRLDVQYGPVHATVTPTQVTAVEGDHVTLTCSSDCSPSCTYTWSRLNDDTFNHAGPVLSFQAIDRGAHDTYSCETTNAHGSKSSSAPVHVNFGSEIADLSPSSGDLFHEDAVVLVCAVDSRPTSTIVIIHKTTELSRSNDGNTLSYTFNSISILDSGDYTCEAGNGIGPSVSESIPLDIKGGFHFCDGQTNHSSHGLALNAMFQNNICQFANPFTEVSRNNWMFVASHETHKEHTLPDGVNITIIPTDHQYRNTINFYIPRISQTHFGTYTMTNGNGHGDDSVYTLRLTPEGSTSATILIVGVTLGAVAAAVIVAVFLILWRKGIFSRKQKTDSKPDTQYENVGVSNFRNVQSDKPPEVQYEDVINLTDFVGAEDNKTYEGLTGEHIIKVPAVYEAFSAEHSSLTKNRPSDIRPGDVISRGAVFCVQAAVILKGKYKEEARNVVMKEIFVADREVYQLYLLEAARVLSRLDSCQHVVSCAGLAGDSLLMENVPLGNLRQYLRGMADHAYANTADVIRKECLGFVRHIIKGLEAVVSITPVPLFYCLSTDHVLLGQGQICKLTGFNTAESVRQREQWEQEHDMYRPIRWSAPEAVDLRHIPESDIWAFGVLVWEIFQFGQEPYPDCDVSQTVVFVKCGHRQLEMSPATAQSVREFVATCWLISPEVRPSLQRVSKVFGKLNCD